MKLFFKKYILRPFKKYDGAVDEEIRIIFFQ